MNSLVLLLIIISITIASRLQPIPAFFHFVRQRNFRVSGEQDKETESEREIKREKERREGKETKRSHKKEGGRG